MSTPEVTPRRAATRRRLADAAIPIFAARGVEAATVEEICDAAGFTRGAFYSNFESKDELCVEVMRGIAMSTSQAAEAVISSSNAPTIPEALSVFFATSPNDRDAILVMAELRLYVVRHPSLRKPFADLHREAMKAFTQIIDAALATRGMRTSMPTSDLIELLEAVYQQTAIAHLTETGFDVDAVRDHIEMVLKSQVVQD